MKPSHTLAAVSLALVLAAAPVSAQDTIPLAVGSVAPDFALGGGNGDGVLRQRLRLSDLHDKTVVIAFFYKAKTKG